MLPYDDRLSCWPNYLQQLVMESPRQVGALDGTPMRYDTVPVWWGGPATDPAQFFPALHQAPRSCRRISSGVVRADHPYADKHAALLANLLAQTEAFARVRPRATASRYAGNRPSTLILLDALTDTRSAC